MDHPLDRELLANEALVIDGSYGEGGGQILRTALGLAAVTGRRVRIVDIRAGRRRPGLAAQHLSAARAVAAVCGAALEGDELGSQTLELTPREPPAPGAYLFDVEEASRGGSAGAASLVLQALLPALAVAAGASTVTLRGGTHVAWSPPFDYVRDVLVRALAGLGIEVQVELRAYGWFPVGRGEIGVRVQGRAGARPRSLELVERGHLRRVVGRAVVANLPVRIAERMAGRGRALLEALGADVQVAAEAVRAACPGAGIFLTAEYERVRCGFNALGARGKPAEAVAEEAVGALLGHAESGACLDVHLADQILAVLALAGGPSRFTVERISHHLETNAWVVERFGLARVSFEEEPGGTGLVTVVPASGNVA
jgi:RNA 3'-terminal phosphate cyclase (ATP)